MKELLPCPFCGSDADYEFDPGVPEDDRYYSVGCSNYEDDCIAVMIITGWKSLDSAIKAWNTRQHQAAAGVETPSPAPVDEKWECFCDEANYHKWAVRDKNGDLKMESAIHVDTKEEAEFLVEKLNKHYLHQPAEPVDLGVCAMAVPLATNSVGRFDYTDHKDIAKAVLRAANITVKE